MVSKRAFTAVAMGASAALLIAGCSGPANGDAGGEDGTFDIVMVAALTGGLSTSAQGQVDGMQAAVDSINEDGGILGQEVTLSVIDDQLDPTKSVSLLQEKIDQGKPDLVIHGQTSNQALAMLPLLTRNQILSFGQAQSAEIGNPEKFPYAFAINASTLSDTEYLVETLKERGVEKAALITANDALGEDMVNTFTELLTEADLELAVELFSPTDMSMVGQLQRLKDENPDILIPGAYGAAAGHLLSSRTQLGWDIPALGSTMLGNGNNLAEISTEADWNNLELTVFSVNTHEHPKTEAYEELTKRLEDAGARMDTLFQHYSFQWDALHLVKRAAEEADSTDAADIAKALEEIESFGDEDSVISFPGMRYSAENHFPDLGSVDYAHVVVNPGPVVRGVIESVE